MDWQIACCHVNMIKAIQSVAAGHPGANPRGDRSARQPIGFEHAVEGVSRNHRPRYRGWQARSGRDFDQNRKRDVVVALGPVERHPSNHLLASRVDLQPEHASHVLGGRSATMPPAPQQRAGRASTRSRGRRPQRAVELNPIDATRAHRRIRRGLPLYQIRPTMRAEGHLQRVVLHFRGEVPTQHGGDLRRAHGV